MQELPSVLKNIISRREMLKISAMTIPAVAMGGCGLGGSTGAMPRNAILFMTDQERPVMHFPDGWEAQNLPALTRLKQNGLTFNRAYTNACMCSPARSTLMSGFFPAQHGVKYTDEQNMTPLSTYPDQFSLPYPPGTANMTPQPGSTSINGDANGNATSANISIANLGTVAAACGFNSVYKGKWHCSKPLDAGGTWAPQDLEQYGFNRWNPQDAGANQNVSEAGGAPNASTATQNNDLRFMNDNGDVATGHEGVLAFLNSQAAAEQPFFLVISLVNPHDVLAYPSNFSAFGYDNSWLDGYIELPETVNEDLSTKPSVQAQFLQLFNFSNATMTPQQQVNYINFYANLMKLQDQYLSQILDALDNQGLTNDTLIIRTSDHGEMGLAHGGLRQKNFNMYEEALRVPLVYSNPKMFPRPLTSDALVSHVDFLPTFASLYGYQSSTTGRTHPLHCAGVDYSSIIRSGGFGAVQDYVVFTYDDYQSGQASPIFPSQPNHIASIVQAQWKFAEYYDPAGVTASQFEMYDLSTDALEQNNLANSLSDPTVAAQFQKMQSKLNQVKSTRLQPLTGGYYLSSFSS